MNKLIVRAQAALANKKAEVYVSKVIWILATIIVGMLLMWGIYNIFSTFVLPNIQANITDLFGTADDLVSKDGNTDFTADPYVATP